MGKVLSVDEILALSDQATQEIEAPAWGGVVKIKTLSKATETAIRQQCSAGEAWDGIKFEKLLFQAAVVEPKFTLEQVEALWQQSSVFADVVLAAIFKLAGTNREGFLTEKAVAEAEQTFCP